MRKSKEFPMQKPVQSFGNDSTLTGDPASDGVFLQNLKKGDVVRVETAMVAGYGLVIDMQVGNPQASAVAVRRVVQRTGFFVKLASPEAIGVNTPVTVARGFRPGQKKPLDGWIGLQCRLSLCSTNVAQPVAAILINGQSIFPQPSSARH